MALSLGLGLHHKLSQQLEQRLTLGQRLEIKATLLTSRLELTHAVYGQEYKPRAECPGCGRRLNPLEIIMGFVDDPRDYTTECTNCHRRFEPRLAWRDDYGGAEIPFYCSIQVLDKLTGMADKTPEEIEKEYPAVFHSVRVHHGTLRRAFEQIGIQYQYESVHNWQERVQDFLGKLPDTVIAEVVDTSVGAIRRLRKSLRISAFKERDLLEVGKDLEVEMA